MTGYGLYSLLPPLLQDMACSAMGLVDRRVRMGSEFRSRLRCLSESESSPRDAIEEYQARSLADLVDHGYRTVPHYRRAMDAAGVSPGQIQGPQDLSRLPVLRKEDVINQGTSLLSVGFPGRVRKGKTSGTTGTSLRFFTTPEAVAFQWAVWWRHRARFGVQPGERHLNFTGKLVVPPGRGRPPYWRWNWPMNQAMVNMQHITPEKVPAIAEFARLQGFRFYSGYPSIINSFALMLQQQGISDFQGPEFIFPGAENILEDQRRHFEEILGARISDQYGFSEGCGNASRCEAGRYHEDWEFCVLECLDPVVQPDGSIQGRIAATGFANRAFPFIRYEVGDIAVWEPPGFRCECGRQSTVLRRIEGRTEDYVVTPEGAHIMRFDYLFKDTQAVREAQVIQREPGAIVIRLVPRSGFSNQDEQLLRQGVRDWISESLEVEFDVVDAIPRTAGGKFRAVVSELDGRPR